jgi:hypothetical protein
LLIISNAVPSFMIHSPPRWRWHFPHKRRFSQQPHGFNFQNRAFFIDIAVNISNLIT